jgi:hypothetical protein
MLAGGVRKPALAMPGISASTLYFERLYPSIHYKCLFIDCPIVQDCIILAAESSSI